MEQHSIKNVMSPANKFEAVNKAYADRIKYKTAIDNIPDTVMTDHTLYIFPAAKAIASGKIKICEMWFERLADEWIATSSPMFSTACPGFHKFSRGLSLLTFFTGSPPMVGLAIFASIELPWVSLKIKNLILKIDSWVRWPRVVIWVLCQQAMLTSFTTMCCNIEFYARELCWRVLRPRAWISSELVMGQKWWVSWSRD